MIGHGQVEGYREKYGMEYRHAKWSESVDEGLVRGHEWRIFPLTHRRAIFADVENFLLYDFYATGGQVNEDVFAYSNRHNDERGLVVYHNKFAETRGWVKTSAAYMDKASGKLVQSTLGKGLGFPHDGYAIFKDYVSGMEYIRPCRELVEKGLYVELGSYQCHVFLDWRFVNSNEWGMVNEALNGAGAASVQAKYDELFAVKEEVKSKKVVTKKSSVRKAAAKKAAPAGKAKTAGKKKPAVKKKTE
jgi:hypothetical protein